MRLLLFVLLIVGCWCEIRILIDRNGGYNITVNNQVWLRSSRTAIYADDRWYSTEDMSLPMDDVRTVFPSFMIEKMDQSDHRGYFRVGGEVYVS